MQYNIFSDFLSRFRIAYLIQKKTSVIIRRSRFILHILEILYKAGYISGYKFLHKIDLENKINGKKDARFSKFIYNEKHHRGYFYIEIFFKYQDGFPLFNEISEIGTSVTPIFLPKHLILKNYPFSIFTVLSTSRGIITNRDYIFNDTLKMGGRVLFTIK